MHNGWTNYQTWIAHTWMYNEQPSQEYWIAAAREAWDDAQDDNDPSARARLQLAGTMNAHHDEMPDEIVNATTNTVYADLLTNALAQIEWIDIADHWLEAADLPGYQPRRAPAAQE